MADKILNGRYIPLTDNRRVFLALLCGQPADWTIIFTSPQGNNPAPPDTDHCRWAKDGMIHTQVNVSEEALLALRDLIDVRHELEETQ